MALATIKIFNAIFLGQGGGGGGSRLPSPHQMPHTYPPEDVVINENV